ncbi:ribonuclease J [Patescibacteria group bacterium]|nr:ribonuclease J [Patescibacteria group bacterium]MCL5733630.1 ribonuclease J [Patescibacteria group bacterium]
MINQNKTKISHSSSRGAAGAGQRRYSRSAPRREQGRSSFSGAQRFHSRSAEENDIHKSAVVSTHRAPDTEPKLRFVPLGGLEEIGRNMMFFEYKNEIVIIDVGLQFPEEETPGIDFIIPNIAYLEPRKANIRGIILSHAHYDHIGALPYLIGKLGNPPIYATALTKEIVLKRQEDFPNQPKLNITVVKNHDKIKISNYFEADFFGIPHTIPDATGVLLRTPVGNIANFIDFRVEYDVDGNPLRLNEFEEVGKQGILALMIDSTNAELPGHSMSEKTVEKNLEDLFKEAKGRIIVAAFSSLLDRIDTILKIADKLGRKVAISGYSMKSNVQIAQRLGYLKVKSDLIIPLEEIHRHKDDKIMILTTGAQGESNASLMRIVNGEHRFVHIKPGDTVIFSSSIVPGNERSVQGLKDNLARQGAIIYHSKIIDIHASGHALKEDLKLTMKLVKPKFVVPIHGYYYMRSVNAQNALEAGIPKENAILLDNGKIAEITKDKIIVSKETVPAFYVMVDGLGVGDVEEVVLRDRRVLAQEGMVVIILTLSKDKGRLVKSPDIISRGFIYLKENQKILEDVRNQLKGIISRMPTYQSPDVDYLKTLVRDQVGQMLFTKTKRRPMILPVVIEV